MAPDRLTKTLLAAIAIALLMNAVNPWIQPHSASADVDSDIMRIQRDVHSIERDLGSIGSNIDSIESDLSRIQRGTCSNSILC